jgi:hypothetical protein
VDLVLGKSKAMTEAEWLSSTDPIVMLAELQRNARASDRKLRLFGVACSRRVWPWLDALGRAAVEVAEGYADGLAGPEELRAARLACTSGGDSAVWYAAASNAMIAARNAALSAQAGGHLAREGAAQAALLRDLFGDDCSLLAPVDVAWLESRGATARQLAQTLYEEQAFDSRAMGLLADALEEAGCTDAAILGHCRGGGDHVRGCWVVDVILGKT